MHNNNHLLKENLGEENTVLEDNLIQRVFRVKPLKGTKFRVNSLHHREDAKRGNPVPMDMNGVQEEKMEDAGTVVLLNT